MLTAIDIGRLEGASVFSRRQRCPGRFSLLVGLPRVLADPKDSEGLGGRQGRGFELRGQGEKEGEGALLAAFDRHRDRICEVASKVYRRRIEGAYTLTAQDFS